MDGTCFRTHLDSIAKKLKFLRIKLKNNKIVRTTYSNGKNPKLLHAPDYSAARLRSPPLSIARRCLQKPATAHRSQPLLAEARHYSAEARRRFLLLPSFWLYHLLPLPSSISRAPILTNDVCSSS